MNITEEIASVLADGPLGVFEICAALKKRAGIPEVPDYGRTPTSYQAQCDREDWFALVTSEHYAEIAELGLDLRSVIKTLRSDCRFAQETPDNIYYECGRPKKGSCVWVLVGAGVAL